MTDNVDCEEETTGFLKRARSEKLLKIFNKYASTEINGEKFITGKDFVQKYLGLFTDQNYNEESIKLLAGIVNTSRDGLISFPEFQAFEGLLCVPDALYKTAFQLFDTRGDGMVSFDEFVKVIRMTMLLQKLPFNTDSDFVKLYFGKDKKRLVSYAEFCQFLHDFHEKYAVEAFRQYDKNGTGFISVLDFQDIMVNIKSHLLTKDVRENLVAAGGGCSDGHRVSFPFFVAFNSLLNNMELIKQIYLSLTGGHRDVEVTKEEFLYPAQMMSQITPLQVDILFLLCDLLHQSKRIVYNDLEAIAPEQYFNQITKWQADFSSVSTRGDRSFFTQALEGIYRFILGSIAGAVGASVVYPVDLVKTRMQKQRTGSSHGKPMYKNNFDCFRKVYREEGFRGLYRGMFPQLLAVAPEKAIKLTVNDTVRNIFMDVHGNVTIFGEILSGACAGGAQVIITNPAEAVKIRLQVAGEIAGGAKIGALSVMKELGAFGLYKGAKACFLRDIPFSAIYFPVYSHTKENLTDENGYNHPFSLLVAGTIAGAPAASLVTPADVIKTRLQVAARAGQTMYNGVTDAARKIYKEEGPHAFWKGTTARVFRSSPQFGVTLFTYELLQRLFFIDFGGTRPVGSERNEYATGVAGEMKSTNLDHIGGYKVALPILAGIESKFGLCLLRFKPGVMHTRSEKS